jgi:tetratricopeptide (TPR) repeat protein
MDNAPTQSSVLSTQSSLAQRILALAAHCAPAVPIPLELLRRAMQSPQPPTPNSQLPDAAVHRLVTIGLASYGDEGQALSIHRLVAAYARKQQDEATTVELADTLADVLGSITNAINEGGLPGKMQPLLPHARHATEAAEVRGSEYAAALLNNLGYHFSSIATYDWARALYERALRILEQQPGDIHPNVATLVNNLGTLAHDQGDLQAAHAYLERALRIDEAAFGSDHPKVAIRVNNLGLLAQEQGDLLAARTYLERALRICEQMLGAEHPNTRTARRNLASLPVAGA